MLDDLNKNVPELDENDKNRIYQNLKARETKKTKFTFNKKLIISFASLALIIAIIPAIMIMGKNNNNPTDDISASISDSENKTPTHTYQSKEYSEIDLIGIAAYAEFDKKEEVLPASSFKPNKYYHQQFDLKPNIKEDQNEDEYLKIVYPYDFIAIKEAIKFSIQVDDINDELAKGIIEESCGLGELEVVVATFETFILDKQATLIPAVGDTLVSLRGYNGYYTVLLNCGNESTSIFSSHKKLNDEDIIKDFTPPILSIFVRDIKGSKYVYFETSEDLIIEEEQFNEEYAFQNITKIETVSGDSLYSVIELATTPTKEVEATVVEIDEKSLIVSTDTRLALIFIDDSTEGLKINDIQVGDSILVEYKNPYKSYDPRYVTAIKITANEDKE